MALNSSHFTSIAEVDIAMQREADCIVLNGSPTSLIYTSKLTSFEHHLLTTSPDFARLLILKELYHCHNAVEDKFKVLKQRNRAARSNSDSLRYHLAGFHSAFEEITHLTNPPLLPALSRGTHFLDLGCAPGGFATWLLQHTTMNGVGITLPWQANDCGVTTPGVTNTGIPLHSDLAAFSPRFSVFPRDLFQVATGTLNETIPTESIPATGFDLVIANAAAMLTEDQVSWAKKIHLIFAQLLIAFQHIATGGTLIVSLRTRPFDWVTDIIASLKQIFESVDAVKPKFQAKTSFAYFICQGFIPTSSTTITKQCYIDRLRNCIHYLQDSDEQGIECDTSKISCLHKASYKLSDNEIVNLLTTVWTRQYNAIHDDFERVLNSNQSGLDKTRRASESTGHTKSLTVAESATQPREAGSSNWRNRTAAPQHNDAQIRRNGRDAGFKELFALNRSSNTSYTDGPWRRNGVDLN